MGNVKKNKPDLFFVLSILLILGFVLWNYRSFWLVSQLEFDTIRDGQIRHEESVKAVFANTEELIRLTFNSEVTLSQEQGDRLKKGEIIATVHATGKDYSPTRAEKNIIAPISGLFYAKIDGLEESVTPENLMNMDLGKLLAEVEAKDLGQEPSSSDIKNPLNVGKMVNNLYPSWMFVYLAPQDTVLKGEKVRFIINSEEFVGTVMKVTSEPLGAVIRFSQYIVGSTEQRVQEVIWKVKPTTAGLVVPQRALQTYGEEKGVYIGVGGVIQFRNILVKDANDGLACIEGVPDGAQVVLNPRKGIEGLTLKTGM